VQKTIDYKKDDIQQTKKSICTSLGKVNDVSFKAPMLLIAYIKCPFLKKSIIFKPYFQIL
jgi:hypothetical protein